MEELEKGSRLVESGTHSGVVRELKYELARFRDESNAIPDLPPRSARGNAVGVSETIYCVLWQTTLHTGPRQPEQAFVSAIAIRRRTGAWTDSLKIRPFIDVYHHSCIGPGGPP